MSRGSHRTSTRTEVITHLQQLVGLPLSSGNRAADMRALQFGPLKQVGRASIGDFALHIQCPWRIDGPNGIFTGRMDLHEPVERGPDFNRDDWDPEKSPNLQDSQFAQLLARHGDGLVVSGIEADECGGAAIQFANGFVLRMFPAGTRGEDWRLFRPRTGAPHFVIAKGEVEAADDSEPTAS